MSYTKIAMLVAIIYAFVFNSLAVVLLYFTGVTSKFTFHQHVAWCSYLMLLNILLINLMFYIADVRKPKTDNDENTN